jgi:DNA polymerase-3 subunit alpha
MGKKIAEKMRAEHERFLAGAGAKGYSTADAQTIFDLIEPFAGYAFNKAHAVCYGTISYQTAYLKANYPAEYMTAVLRLAPSHPSGTATRVAASVAECVKLGIPVLPPDINRSGVQFEVEQTTDGRAGVRFGLAIVKNVGESAVEALVAARQAQPERRFTSLEHLCNVVEHGQVNKRVLESLIKCGAFDALGERPALLARLDRAMASGAARHKAAQRGQMDLFGGAQLEPLAPAPVAVDVPTIPRKTILAWEKEHLGAYLSEHPLTDVYAEARRAGEQHVAISELDSELAGQTVRVLGCVASVRKMTTRANKTMAVVTLEDLAGSVEVVLFPERYDRFGALAVDDEILFVRGKVDIRNDSVQLLVEDMTCYESRADVERPAPRRTVRLRVDIAGPAEACEARLRQLGQLLRHFPGDDSVLLVLRGERERCLRSGLSVDWCDDLRRAVEEIIGPAWETSGSEAIVRDRLALD